MRAVSKIRLAECRQAPGTIQPVINRNRCEGKADCVGACPYAVFAIDILPAAARKDLRLIGKLKGWAHGWRQAFVVNAGACQACGACVKACPEHAIGLRKVAPTLAKIDAETKSL